MLNGRARTLDEYMENFRKLIEVSWELVDYVEPYPRTNLQDVDQALGDWLQMQWEYMVEGMLRWTG